MNTSTGIEHRRARWAGMLFMVAAASLFCLMGIMVSVLVAERDESVFWIGWVRFLLGGLVMLVPAMAGAWSLRVYNRSAFILRGVIGSTGMFLLYVTIALVGLGRGTVLMYLMGVVGAVAGIFILKERPRPGVAVAVVLGTAGVLMSCESGFPRGAEWLAIAGAVCSGIALSLIRLLRRTDSNQVVFFSQGLFGTLLLLPFIWHVTPPFSTFSWMLIGVMVSADILGQLCLSAGLSRTPVAHGAALMMLTPILSLMAGLTFFNEQLDPVQWLGCFVVLTSSILTVFSRTRPQPMPELVPVRNEVSS